MTSITRFWVPTLLLVTYANQIVSTQRFPFDDGHNILNRLLPYPLQKYETMEGMDTHESKDELQNLLEVGSRRLEKEKRTNNEIVDVRDSNPSANEQFEKHMNLVLQHVAKKLREIYITPRLGRDIEDNIECQRSRPPFAPRLGKKSAPLTPRMGRQAYDDKC
ncbi:unnamed protein product [Hermetia illucens]|uniref:Uncharacterized protein n=1 Tax=Hermetia illucens TaxID=343691 RepID=A0A7R8YTP2_HERIL|nr:uncharacterized protein LOC119652439 [Hermetia illucens]CAD7084619.1 unnamed protein product [Hermetia illucens]